MGEPLEKGVLLRRCIDGVLLQNCTNCTGLEHSQSQRSLKLLHWFKSYGNFAELVDFCMLVELRQED